MLNSVTSYTKEYYFEEESSREPDSQENYSCTRWSCVFSCIGPSYTEEDSTPGSLHLSHDIYNSFKFCVFIMVVEYLQVLAENIKKKLSQIKTELAAKNPDIHLK